MGVCSGQEVLTGCCMLLLRCDCQQQVVLLCIPSQHSLRSFCPFVTG